MSNAQAATITIAAMGPWDFWASPDGLDLSAEDAAAIKDGTASTEQQDRMRRAGQAAKNALISASAGEWRTS